MPSPGQTLVVSSGNLVVAPSAVTFPNIEADLVYVMTLTVRNRGSTQARLRIKQPTTSHFTLNYVPTGSIAPGMALNADIEFCLSSEEVGDEEVPPLGEFHDCVVVTNGVDEVTVPLKAMIPAPKIEVNNILDLGLVISQTSITQMVPLSNVGGRVAKWKIVFDEGAPFTAVPQEGILAPYSNQSGAAMSPALRALSEADDESLATSISVESSRHSSVGNSSVMQLPCQTEVSLTFDAGAVGPFRSIARLEVEGAITQLLDISAHVVEQNLSVVFLNSKRPLRVVDFGNTLYGDVAVVEALIVNDGPNPLPYFVALEIDRATTDSMAKQIAEDLNVPLPSSGGGRSRSTAAGSAASGNSVTSTQEEGSSMMEAFTATPMEGVLAPYSTQPLTFRFEPTPPKITTGFEREARQSVSMPTPYALKAIIESAKQAVEVAVVGRASAATVVVTMGVGDKTSGFEEEDNVNKPPIHSIRADHVRFGECPMYERRDVLVTVRNTSAAPVNYSFTKIAHFEAKPPGGSLQPMQTISTVLTFRPGQMGKFKKKMKILVENGRAPIEVPIWVSGTSSSAAERLKRTGGIDKLPQDFTPKLQFIDPYIASGVVAAPQRDGYFKDGSRPNFIREKPYEVVNLLQSSSWDESVNGKNNSETSHLTFSVQDLARRAEHKDTYNNWLKEARQQRQTREANRAQSRHNMKANPEFRKLYSRFDDQGIPTHDIEGNPLPGEEILKMREGKDLGMSRGLSDSIGPEPEMPKGDEPLWLLRSKGGDGGSSQKRVTLDDRKLIAKKFKATPSTQAEVRECSTELGSNEHSKIVVSHKTIDFGRVCVGSTSARSLSFTNELQRSILVRLGTMDPALIESTPSSQVIPAGATAGFDIIMTSNIQEIFRRTITYSINDKHSHKISCVAEVVPIEVIMSAKSIEFKFDDEDQPKKLDACVSKTLTLTNPGNCTAEFFWANRGPFVVVPDMGTLAAGASTEVSITWTPSAGQANMQSLALHVPGGEDQQLTVTGKVTDAKCAFTKKKLELGLLPVGISKQVQVGIKNVGKFSAVCFVRDLDKDTTGITIKPSALRIAVGETAMLTITVFPPTAQSYNGQAIEVNVRGAKPIRLPIYGNTIIPDVGFYVPPSRPSTPIEEGSIESNDGSVKSLSIAGAPATKVENKTENVSSGKIEATSDALVAEGGSVGSSKGDPLAGKQYLGLALDGPHMDMLDFRDVTIGGTETLPITLINRSPISASLLLDFKKTPDFSARRCYDLPVGLEDYLMILRENNLPSVVAPPITEGKSVPVSSEATPRNLTSSQNGTPKTQTLNPPTPGADSDQLALPNTDSGGVNVGAEREKTSISPLSRDASMETTKQYSITIGAFHAICLNIDFAPSEPVAHDFKLPLRLSGQEEEQGEEKSNNSAVKRKTSSILSIRNNSVSDASIASSVNRNFPVLSRRIHASGVRPRLIMSKAVVDFSDRVVSRDPNRRVPFTSEVSFTNSSSTGVTWMLDDRSLREIKEKSMGASGDGIPTSAVFFISPKGGDIAPGESITLRVTFSPQDNQEYEAKLPLFLEDQPDKERPYLTLTLRGSGVFPRLDFSTREITLQTVPLGITSRGVFTISNCGYDDLTLSARPTMNAPVPINVEFPDGDNLGLANPSIKAIVSFSHDQPASFQTALELVDSEGKTYTVTVIGATDNSTLTSFSFLQQYSKSFGYYTRDGKPVQFIGKQRIAAFERHELREKEKARGARAAMRAAENGVASSAVARASKGGKQELTLAEELAKCGDEHVDMNLEPNFIDSRLPEFLKEWLNASVMFEPMQQPFPVDFVESRGKLAFDAIDTMAGTKCPGRAKQFSADVSVAWKEVQQQYSTLLLFLKEKGSLLNHIQPYELLAQEDYLKAKEEQYETIGKYQVKLSASQFREKRSQWADQFAEVSKQAWLTLMMQCIRTFVLSRITPKAFQSLPGVLVAKSSQAATPSSKAGKGSKATKEGKGKTGGQDTGGDPELGKSNVYSVAEALLLKWVAYHVNHTTPASALPKRITDFDTSWSDGSLLCHLLHSHRPALVEGEVGEKVDTRHHGSSSPVSSHHKPNHPPLNGYTQVIAFSELKIDKVKNANFVRATKAMKKIMIELELTEDLLLDPHPAITLLFVLHLYSFLPQIVPKTTIEFGATLGKTTSKIIELKNPSGRPIRYRAFLEGCQDFSLPLNEVNITPRSKFDFMVDLNPRFSSPVESRLTLLSSRGAAGVQANHLVFTLRSRVDSRLPLLTKEIETECYELDHVEFDVENPFDIATTFRVKLSQECIEGLAGDSLIPKATSPTSASAVPQVHGARGHKPNKRGNNSKHNDSDNKTDEERAVFDLFQQPFAAKQKTLFLEPGEVGTLGLSFLAFQPGKFKCEVVLLSPEAGEFCYGCTATVKLPKVLDAPLKMTVVSDSAGGTCQRILRLPPKNASLETALNTLLDRLPSAMRTKGRIAGQAMCRPPSIHHHGTSNHADISEVASTTGGGSGGAVPFTVEVDSPFFSTRGKVEIGAERKATTAGGGKVAQLDEVSPETDLGDLGNVILTFNPRAPGAYPCEVLVSACGPAALDIRRYKIDCVVVAPSVETALTFTAPARMGITQLIPLHNKSKEEWNLTASIIGSKSFTGPTTFKVPPLGAKAGYPISFKANWVGNDHEASLVLKNPKSGSEFKYKLNGECVEPLAEEHVVRRCNARESISITLKVPHFVASTNKEGKRESLSCNVESDLPFVAGPEKLLIDGEDGAKYTLTANPPMGGKFTGAITFKTLSGEFLWYTLEFNVDSPLEEKAVELRATVRTVASMQITLENPIAEPITFDVSLTGEGVLGENTFSLEANESASYELFYSPLLVKEHVGSLAFVNDLVGEFWYKLSLIADPAPPTQLETMRAPVGSKTSVPVNIENPIGKDVHLTSKVSNSTNFAVKPSSLNIGPYGHATCYLEYSPSSLGAVPETTTLSLSHPELGFFDFTAEGFGEMPSVMPPVTAMACCGEPSSFMLSFKNPFRAPLTVDIILTNESGVSSSSSIGSSNGSLGHQAPSKEDESFLLLMRKKENISMAPLSSLQVPISFNPLSIAEKAGQVEIRGSTPVHGLPLIWCFPLVGISSAPQYPRAFKVKTKAKQPNRVVLDLPLKALDEIHEPETFDYELVVPPNMQKLVSSSLTVNPVQSTISDANMPIRLQLLFTPMKPFATSIQLVVLRAGGGRWPFEVQLEATEPDVDDSILVESPLRTTGSVTFKLVNRTSSDEFSNFQAFFSSDSSTCLSVSPTSGVLAPESAGGTNFVVSFTPVEYGQRYRGKLIVVTDDTQWTYDVMGDKPKDKTPQVKALVDSKPPLVLSGGGSVRSGGKKGAR